MCIFGSQLFQALGKMEGILGGAYHHGSVLFLFMAGFGSCLPEKCQRLKNAETERSQAFFVLAFVSAVCFWAFIPFEKGRISWKNRNYFYF